MKRSICMLLILSMTLVSCTRTQRAATVSYGASAESRFRVLTDTLRVVDSISVKVAGDTVWRERVRLVNRQVEVSRADTVVRVLFEQQTVPERYVPHWLWYLLAIGAAATAAWLLKALWWVAGLRK